MFFKLYVWRNISGKIEDVFLFTIVEIKGNNWEKLMERVFFGLNKARDFSHRSNIQRLAPHGIKSFKCTYHKY